MIYTQIRRPEALSYQSPQGPSASEHAQLVRVPNSAQLQRVDREDGTKSPLINFALFLR
jgi:hypothetical protein